MNVLGGPGESSALGSVEAQNTSFITRSAILCAQAGCDRFFKARLFESSAPISLNPFLKGGPRSEHAGNHTNSFSLASGRKANQDKKRKQNKQIGLGGACDRHDSQAHNRTLLGGECRPSATEKWECNRKSRFSDFQIFPEISIFVRKTTCTTSSQCGDACTPAPQSMLPLKLLGLAQVS